VHALTIFLGVDVYTNTHTPSSIIGGESNQKEEKTSTPQQTFLSRMLAYMPRHHRAFLLHLSTTPLRLRDLVLGADDPGLREAYNSAVRALKEFRDAHMIVVTLYIVGPARRAKRDVSEGYRGTGGTDVVRFLKGVRDTTARAVIQDGVGAQGSWV
jgi:indoleamine 2,3-dioxygenase